MEGEQYHPVGASPVAKNRLFCQFHAQYPKHEREQIVKNLVEGTSKLQVLFVTVAFGIGIDLKKHKTSHSHWCTLYNGGVFPESWALWS